MPRPAVDVQPTSSATEELHPETRRPDASTDDGGARRSKDRSGGVASSPMSSSSAAAPAGGTDTLPPIRDGAGAGGHSSRELDGLSYPRRPARPMANDEYVVDAGRAGLLSTTTTAPAVESTSSAATVAAVGEVVGGGRMDDDRRVATALGDSHLLQDHHHHQPHSHGEQHLLPFQRPPSQSCLPSQLFPTVAGPSTAPPPPSLRPPKTGGSSSSNAPHLVPPDFPLMNASSNLASSSSSSSPHGATTSGSFHDHLRLPPLRLPTGPPALPAVSGQREGSPSSAPPEYYMPSAPLLFPSDHHLLLPHHTRVNDSYYSLRSAPGSLAVSPGALSSHTPYPTLPSLSSAPKHTHTHPPSRQPLSATALPSHPPPTLPPPRALSLSLPHLPPLPPPPGMQHTQPHRLVSPASNHLHAPPPIYIGNGSSGSNATLSSTSAPSSIQSSSSILPNLVVGPSKPRSPLDGPRAPFPPYGSTHSHHPHQLPSHSPYSHPRAYSTRLSQAPQYSHPGSHASTPRIDIFSRSPPPSSFPGTLSSASATSSSQGHGSSSSGSSNNLYRSTPLPQAASHDPSSSHRQHQQQQSAPMHLRKPPPAPRTAIACQRCRSHKLKCDGARQCSNCAKRGVPHDCTYVQEIKRRGKGKGVKRRGMEVGGGEDGDEDSSGQEKRGRMEEDGDTDGGRDGKRMERRVTVDSPGPVSGRERESGLDPPRHYSSSAQDFPGGRGTIE